LAPSPEPNVFLGKSVCLGGHCPHLAPKNTAVHALFQIHRPAVIKSCSELSEQLSPIVLSPKIPSWSFAFMAPRANWKGFLRLSFVTCPVALYPATS